MSNADKTGNAPTPEFLADLRLIVGDAGWCDDAAQLQPHLNEWRGAVQGATPAMVSPASTDEVAEVLRLCHAARVAVVPQGGNTGMCAGAVPDASGRQILLNLRRMNRVRDVNVLDASMQVEAGCILADVQSAARSVDRYFPLSLGGEGSCQIGGNLATNAGGINVLRYGVARDLVLGLEVVLSDGRVLDACRSVRKDTAGYDLKQLFIGSEGTLGVITAAVLKLLPPPGRVATAFLALTSVKAAVELLAALQERSGNRVLAFELIGDVALQMVMRHIPGSHLPFDAASAWYVLLDVDAEDDLLLAVLEQMLATGNVAEAVIAKNETEAKQFWRMRHSVSAAEKASGVAVKHDIAVPTVDIPRFIETAAARLQRDVPEARPVVFGHVGDGNLHYNVALETDKSPIDDLVAKSNKVVYDLVMEHRGSISAEHGVGVLKRAALAEYKSDTEMALYRSLKQALDPHNILNPGKVI